MPERVTLEMDVPTVIKVISEPRTQVTHSAVLTIDNDNARGLEQSALLAVEAATRSPRTPLGQRAGV
ncbi:hypothetical protein ACFT7S_07225 [Streptomyces sp. NPDC057136]|uniref:hypothetical protein n=1 Tax=Streptomyces sp. NPDC057136 TaxID=3346029 RepID=UPI0036322449